MKNLVFVVMYFIIGVFIFSASHSETPAWIFSKSICRTKSVPLSYLFVYLLLHIFNLMFLEIYFRLFCLVQY